jgi:hypothetical protein
MEKIKERKNIFNNEIETCVYFFSFYLFVSYLLIKNKKRERERLVN